MVKKFTLVCGVVLALLVLAIAVVAVSAKSSAKADSPFVEGNQTGAVVTKDFPCGIVVPTGGEAVTTRSHDVQTPSGKETLVCHAHVVNPTGREASRTGILCVGSHGITTTDSRNEESASGQLTLTCHFPTRP